MSVFLLIRHGHNDAIGKRIVGRSPGIHLNDRGREQAERLAERLKQFPIRAVYCSPLERTRQTAEPLASRLGAELHVSHDIHEVEFGEWSGLSFEELEEYPRWKQFNVFRSGTRIPGGELMTEVQSRMVAAIESLREQHRDEMIAVVSHGDPIKTVIAHYGGIPIDHMLRFEISLTSVSILAIHDYGPKILCVNNTGEEFPFWDKITT